MIKNDPWSRDFLRKWWAAGAKAHWQLDEQHALWHVLLELTPGYRGQCARGAIPTDGNLLEQCAKEAAKEAAETQQLQVVAGIYDSIQASAPVYVHHSPCFHSWPGLERHGRFGPSVVEEYPWRAGASATSSTFLLHTHMPKYVGCDACSFGVRSGLALSSSSDSPNSAGFFNLELDGNELHMPATDAAVTADAVCSYYAVVSVANVPAAAESIIYAAAVLPSVEERTLEEHAACVSTLTGNIGAVIKMEVRPGAFKTTYDRKAALVSPPENWTTDVKPRWTDSRSRTERPASRALLEELQAEELQLETGGLDFINGMNRGLVLAYCCGLHNLSSQETSSSSSSSPSSPPPPGRAIFSLVILNQNTGVKSEIEVLDTWDYGWDSYSRAVDEFCSATPRNSVCDEEGFREIVVRMIDERLAGTMNKVMGQCWNWWWQCPDSELNEVDY
jgi:hypothetical protein